MPRGPRGEKRPADVISNAIEVMRIASGEETETPTPEDGKNAPPSRSAGGAVRLHCDGGRGSAEAGTARPCKKKPEAATV